MGSIPIEYKDMAMTLLCGLPDRFDSIITTLDALGDDADKFSFDFVNSRCHQGEQRQLQREHDSLQRAETAALIASKGKPKGTCIHCGRHNNSDKCWKKYPHLAPDRHPYKTKYKAPLTSGTTINNTEECETVCLLKVSHSSEEDICLTTVESGKRLVQGKNPWIIDSGCSSHLTYDKSSFSTYTLLRKSTVDLGADATADIIGCGDVKLYINVNGKRSLCTIKNVKHVPSLGYKLLSVSVLAKMGIVSHFNDKRVALIRSSDNKTVATGSVTPNGLGCTRWTKNSTQVEKMSVYLPLLLSGISDLLMDQRLQSNPLSLTTLYEALSTMILWKRMNALDVPLVRVIEQRFQRKVLHQPFKYLNFFIAMSWDPLRIHQSDDPATSSHLLMTTQTGRPRTVWKENQRLYFVL